MKIVFGWVPVFLALSAAGAAAQGAGDVSVKQVAAAQKDPGTAGKPADDGASDQDGAAVPAGGSQVRIVRLSETREKVLLDRNTGNGFEPTIMNLPIVQGEKLRTVQGWAEVEFEDNSTLRITPQTQIEFAKLARLSTGETTNAVTLLRGTSYVNLAKTKGNEFVVRVGGKVVTLPPASHVRMDVYPAGSEIYVFHGQVTVTDALGTVAVEKGRALRFGGPMDAAAVVAKGSEAGMYDEWDRKAVEYHAMRTTFAQGSGYAYGLQDLSYYGSFSNVAGCGQMWRPYFTSAGWDPFANGVWAYYPGAGYSYVSPYPWGWVPFHTGMWASCGGGWGWQPGGQWAGLANHVIFKPIKGPRPIRPIHPPTLGHPSMVLISKTPLPFAHVGAGEKFVFTKDSAGLGVPRAVFGKLDKISSQVMVRGSVERPVQVNAMEAAGRTGEPGHVGAIYGASSGRMESRPVSAAAAGGRSGGGNPGSGGGGNLSGGSSAGSHGSAPAPVSTPSNAVSSASSSPASSGGSHH